MSTTPEAMLDEENLPICDHRPWQERVPLGFLDGFSHSAREFGLEQEGLSGDESQGISCADQGALSRHLGARARIARAEQHRLLGKELETANQLFFVRRQFERTQRDVFLQRRFAAFE